ncbi:hypothetical protein Tco_0997255 [Tanacetum coccineum]
MHIAQKPQGNQPIRLFKRNEIIVIPESVEIVEWQDYKHLDWITVRRDDDVLYKFKEGDFHRLRIQDIEDMLTFFLRAKEKAFGRNFNWVLKAYRRNSLTKPDTYRSTCERQDAYNTIL